MICGEDNVIYVENEDNFSPHIFKKDTLEWFLSSNALPELFRLLSPSLK